MMRASGTSTEARSMQLARKASIEINVHDIKHLGVARGLVATGTRTLIPFLANQKWSDSLNACQAVRRAGLEPIPHIPVRLLPDRNEIGRAHV